MSEIKHTPATHSLTKARVERVCTKTAWHAGGCGRVIKRGERYLRIKSPGLSDFGVCAECAAISKAAESQS